MNLWTLNSSSLLSIIIQQEIIKLPRYFLIRITYTTNKLLVLFLFSICHNFFGFSAVLGERVSGLVAFTGRHSVASLFTSLRKITFFTIHRCSFRLSLHSPTPSKESASSSCLHSLCETEYSFSSFGLVGSQATSKLRCRNQVINFGYFYYVARSVL